MEVTNKSQNCPLDLLLVHTDYHRWWISNPFMCDVIALDGYSPKDHNKRPLGLVPKALLLLNTSRMAQRWSGFRFTFIRSDSRQSYYGKECTWALSRECLFFSSEAMSLVKAHTCRELHAVHVQLKFHTVLTTSAVSSGLRAKAN